MYFKRITPESVRLLREGMSQTAFRHNLITHNIANVDTPGYVRKDVTFDEALKRATVELVSQKQKSEGVSARKASVRLSVYEDGRPSLRQDGSNVDIDEEMALMAMNAGDYLKYVELHDRQMRLIRAAISERLP